MTRVHPPPILFLVFNRPDLAQRVFERIRAARPTRLFIAADGPRPDHPDDIQACRETRLLVEQVDWPCEVKTLFREKNLGCRLAVESAITWFFEHEEAGIILEDDCLPDPSFFPFCSELLNRYKDDTQVMSVSGDCFFPDEFISESSYTFMIYVHIWGWATWRRAWKQYDPSLKGLKELCVRKWLNKLLNSTAAAEYWAEILRRYMAGEINTWDYPWLFSCWLHRGLSVVPTVNLVSNIGFDSRGTHTDGAASSKTGHPLGQISFPLQHPMRVTRDTTLERKTEGLYVKPAKQSKSAWHHFVRTMLHRVSQLCHGQR